MNLSTTGITYQLKVTVLVSAAKSCTFVAFFPRRHGDSAANECQFSRCDFLISSVHCLLLYVGNDSCLCCRFCSSSRQSGLRLVLFPCMQLVPDDHAFVPSQRRREHFVRIISYVGLDFRRETSCNFYVMGDFVAMPATRGVTSVVVECPAEMILKCIVKLRIHYATGCTAVQYFFSRLDVVQGTKHGFNFRSLFCVVFFLPMSVCFCSVKACLQQLN